MKRNTWRRTNVWLFTSAGMFVGDWMFGSRIPLAELGAGMFFGALMLFIHSIGENKS